MSILLIFVGIVFLLNPMLWLFDILPDFIGCFFILAGLSELSCVEYRLENAKKYTCWLLAASVIKTFSSMYVFTNDKNYLLPLSLLFAVVDTIILVGFFISLFGGLEYLSTRYASRDHSSRSERASVICFIFSIVRGVTILVPELFGLGAQRDNFNYTFEHDSALDLVALKPYVTLLCTVLILIFGIYTFVVCTVYFINLIRDKQLRDSSKRLYSEYVDTHRGTFNLKHTKSGLFLFFLSMPLLLNVLLDNANIAPSALALVIAGSAFVYMAKISARKHFLYLLIPVFAAIPLSLYNNYIQYKLYSETVIEIKGVTINFFMIPDALQSPSGLPAIIIPIIFEYILIGAIMILAVMSLEKLPYLRFDDSVSIYQLLFHASSFVFLVSGAAIYALPFVRTVYSFNADSIEIYASIDRIISVSEWICYISLIVMLYFAYKYGCDLLSRVMTDEEMASAEK